MKKPEYRAISFMCELPVARDGTTMIRTPEDTWVECREMRDLGQETFVVLALNTRNRLLDKRMIGMGVVDSCLVHAREVFRRAISESASAVILVHNHPSGDPSPSAEDVKLTKQMIQGGQVLGIKVLDHVIIGRKHDNDPASPSREFMSMREAGLCEFT